MIEYQFNVLIPEGLHARPCAKLIDILKIFEPLHITHREHTIKILSILELLLQKISYGSVVTISTNEPLPPVTIEKLNCVFSNQ